MYAVLYPTAYEAQPCLAALKGPQFIVPVESYRQIKTSGAITRIGYLQNKPCIVGIVGIGEKLAYERTLTILRVLKPKMAILAGFAGALHPDWTVGDLGLIEGHDELLSVLQRWQVRRSTTSTLESLAGDPALKKELHAILQTDLIDMETRACLNAAKATGVPLIVLRGVSDTHDQFIPAAALLKGYNPQDNKPTPLRLAFHLLAHPGSLPPFLRFVQRLPAVRLRLAQCVEAIVRSLPAA